ncbi:alpha/beta fold hydrolase [Granulosicoccaceae sp. 1_MG-2023]|nr:alpha/beta fold hydrolase [Granulosicoccaceae sp. 1_MG-2023]
MSDLIQSAVQFSTYSGELFGTHCHKDKQGRSVVVLLLADGGAIDRNGNSADGFNQSRCLQALAGDLVQLGIPSLRYDKRGTGLSAMALPHPAELTLEDYVEDAIHAIQYLRNEQAYERVVVAGHGEGALIGMLASQQVPVDGLICIGASARNGAQLLHEQLSKHLSPENLVQADAIIQQLYEGRFVDAVPDTFAHLFSHDIQPLLMSLFRTEPTAALRAVDAPVLLLHGSRDIQVPFSDANALKAARSDATLLFVEGMNHVLKAVDADTQIQLEQYRNPALPVCRQLTLNMVSFIGRLLRRADTTHKVTDHA